VIKGSEIDGVKLWFDSSSSGTRGVIDSGELVDLLPNFKITLPVIKARPSSSGGITPIDEASASWDASSVGSLFAVAIPYQSPPVLNESIEYFSRPTVKLNIDGIENPSNSQSFQVAEDPTGGVKFTLDLEGTLIPNSSYKVKTLIKIYGVPSLLNSDVILSTGVKIKPTANVNDDFWLLTDDQVLDINGNPIPISIVGLPKNYIDSFRLSAQAVSSIVAGGKISTLRGDISSEQEFDFIEVADQPLLVASSNLGSSIGISEGGNLYFTTDGSPSSISSIQLTKSDSNEDLYVRFSLHSSSSNYLIKRIDSVGKISTLDAINEKYEVSYSDIENKKVYIDFNDYYHDAVK
ncbi:hypothetical protein EBR37_04490, partial [bacterium]|nr:hypothetical protein [bacterium]